MKVTVIFDPAFSGTTGSAVWIIDTPANKKWFDAQRDLDPNSATFRADHHPDLDSAVIHAVWDAQEHHPAWDQINVLGAALTVDIAAEVQQGAEISRTPTGFRLNRL